MLMKLILKKAHIYFYVCVVAFVYCLIWPFVYFCSRKPSRYGSINLFRKVWAFISSLLSGFVYQIKYETQIDWSKTYIICPNHTSNLDITSANLLVKKNNYCFMGKEELLDGFVTKLFFKTIDIPVNRDSKMSSFRAFKKASERLQEGTSLIIFPEGKIADDYPPQLHEFKNGPFRLAIEFKIPIIPVTSLNTWQMLWDTGLKYGSRPGISHIFVHKPIGTAHLTLDDADKLRDEVYNLMQQKFEQQ
jgi:1-acyl-sn-glycerol-3-phosphate acyltransferase